MKSKFNKPDTVYPHGSLREQPEMKKGRFAILRSYYNRKYYSGHIKWLLTDDKGDNVYCDKCGNIANGIMTIGKFNIPLCKKHGIEIFPHLDYAPFFEEYKKIAVPIVAQETEEINPLWNEVYHIIKNEKWFYDVLEKSFTIQRRKQ